MDSVKTASSLELNLKDFIVSSDLDCQSMSNIAKSVSLLSEDLHAAIEQLTTTLATVITTSDSSHLSLFIPPTSAIIGACSAYAFNFFHWKMVEKKKKESDICLALISLIGELESLTVDYWTQDYKEDDQKAEIYIKSKIRLVVRYINNFSKKNKTNKTIDINAELDKFGLDIFDLITGDDFESKQRKASKQKAMKISYQCSDIKALISSYC